MMTHAIVLGDYRSDFLEAIASIFEKIPTFRKTDASTSADIISVLPGNEWHSSALRQLLSIKEIEVNWDSYGSPPPTSIAVSSTEVLINILSEISQQKLFSSTNLTPVPGGGIQIDWTFKDLEVEAEILPDGLVVLTAFFEDNQLGEIKLTHLV